MTDPSQTTADAAPPSAESAFLAALMQAAVDGIVVTDASGTMLRVNDAAARLFGLPQERMIGQSLNMLMPEALSARHDGFIDHHLATGARRIIGKGRNVEGRRADGTVVPVHLSVGRTDIDGHAYFIGILHDLTDRQAAQNALARSQRLDAIGQLTGGIAHDFNNLLTVIIGNLELLQMRAPLAERPARLVSGALDAAQLGADLTSRLLVFARKGRLAPMRVDLREECRDALAILQRTIGERYRIRTDFAEAISAVMVDPVQLQSALINLALNARDAMPDGGELLICIADVTIDDAYMAQEAGIAPGRYVRLFLSDEGTGMSPEAQRRAFEPFYSTRSDTGGTGLGLAMVYGFVRQSGGHITLYSELGHGTSFGLYFPALPEDAAGPEPGRAEVKQSVPPGAGQVILVVEDNPRVRQLSVERIRNLGYRTAEAPDGDAAYAMIRAGLQVHLVFSDLVMPGALNGYDLAMRIAAEFPDVKVLLTSDYASDVVSKRIGGTPDHVVLHKPYHQAELAARLQALLGTSP